MIKISHGNLDIDHRHTVEYIDVEKVATAFVLAVIEQGNSQLGLAGACGHSDKHLAAVVTKHLLYLFDSRFLTGTKWETEWDLEKFHAQYFSWSPIDD